MSANILQNEYEKLEGDSIKTLPLNFKGDAFSTLYDSLWYLHYANVKDFCVICISHPHLTEEEEDLLYTLRDFLIKKSNTNR